MRYDAWPRPQRRLSRRRDDSPSHHGRRPQRHRTWGADIVEQGVEQAGIGEDGEADLAICRLDDIVGYCYRDPDAEAPEASWKLAGSHVASGQPVDVGATAAGSDPSYQVEGHFNWMVLERGVASDGGSGALEALVLPEDG